MFQSTMEKPKIIQMLGTSSNSGKAVIAMMLCRYFSNRGYRVAPFKSINMPLNSISISGGYSRKKRIRRVLFVR